MEAGSVLVPAAAVGHSDLRDVEVSDRIDRGVELGAFDAIDESPFLSECGTFGELMADLGAVG